MSDTPSWPSWLAFFEAAIKLARSEENKHRLCEDKDSSTPLSLLTRPEAAAKLNCSEKTLRRHIKQKKIRAVKRSFRGQRQWTIEPYDLNRYQMSKWVERHVDYRLTLNELCKEENLACATVYPFGPWEARLPTFTIKVSLAEYCRYTRPHSQEEDDTFKAELRPRLPGEPENFQVRFYLNKPDWKKELRDRYHLRANILQHFAKNLIPADIKGNPVHYLRSAIKNRCADIIREKQRKRRYRAELKRHCMEEQKNKVFAREEDRNLYLKPPPPSSIDTGLFGRNHFSCPECGTTYSFSNKLPIMECPYCHSKLPTPSKDPSTF